MLSQTTRLAFFVCLALAVSTGRGERPTAPYLLPADTLAYLRVADVPELVEKFGDTSMGRIVSDPQVQPLMSDLYRSAVDAFQGIGDRLGAPLDELLRIPRGELAVAVLAIDQGDPQVIILIDVGDQLPAAEIVLEHSEAVLAEQGASRSVEMFGETRIIMHRLPGNRREIVHFERDGIIGVASDKAVVQQLLGVWDGQEIETLAENRRFTSIMKRCVGFRDEAPQITWYADPIALAKRVTRGNFSAQATISIMSGLGIDGLKAVGGSIIFGAEEFDSIFHTHLLIETPRNGVLKMIAFEAGEVTPEPWVPQDAASYTTLNWNVEQTYGELVELYDQFRGEDAWKIEILDRVADRADVDLEREIIRALAGRGTMVTWIERPARVNSQANLVALKLKDAQQFQGTLDKVVRRFENRFERKTYGGATYYRVEVGNRRRRDALDTEIARRPTPCAAIIGDYLIATDSEKLLEQVVITKNDSSLSLANELDFKLIANKIERQLGETEAGMISFNRPEEGIRLLYELATARTMQDRLSSQSEDNRFFGALDNALKKNPLPPFAVLAKYLAPGGALITDDETGIHYAAFNLRRE